MALLGPRGRSPRSRWWLLALLCASCGGDTQVGSLRADVQQGEAAEPEPVRGWIVASESSSLFEAGALLYGEWQLPDGQKGVLEMDLPPSTGQQPVIRYSEWRGEQRAFDGTAVSGELELSADLFGEQCGCSGGAFGLTFADGTDQRVLWLGQFDLEAGACGASRWLDPEAPLRWRRVDECRTTVVVQPPPTPTTVIVADPDPGYTHDGCGSTSGGYYEADDSSGCEGTASERDYGDDSSGCEGDTTSAPSASDSSSGCESDGTGTSDSSTGCETEGDDTSAASSCETEGDSLSSASPRRRRRPLVPGLGNAVTFALVMLVPRRRRRD